MSEPWLLYGATGYSGRRIAQMALAIGERPVLAARREQELRSLAGELGLEWVAFDLVDKANIERIIGRHSVVLNAAGPFIQTYRPMVEACIATGTHYLDITGEVDVYEGLASYHDHARQAGVMILPAVGFDMVPGDCLALMLSKKVPDATELALGYSFDGTISRGSARTALTTLSPEIQVRRDGTLVKLTEPITRTFDFGPHSSAGAVDCVSMTFGDISVSWRTTGIPSITAYVHVTKAFQDLAAISDPYAMDQLPLGPSDKELASGLAFVVGEIRNSNGITLRGRLTTPQVYAITFSLAADIAQRVNQGAARPGFQTPAAMFGERYILTFDGCQIEWLTD